MTDSSKENINKRPFFLSILCMAIFVYAGFLALLFLLALIFNTWVTSTLDNFFPEKTLTGTPVIIISLFGFLLNVVSLIGAQFLWKLRRLGFYFYLISNLIFVFFPFVIGYGNLYSAIILIIIPLLLSLYYRKLS